jgi:hypothetical protein
VAVRATSVAKKLHGATHGFIKYEVDEIRLVK